MQFIKGNLFEAKTDALVNAVNTVGVMGKGIALQFKERFPQNFKVYHTACKVGELTVGKFPNWRKRPRLRQWWAFFLPKTFLLRHFNT